MEDWTAAEIADAGRDVLALLRAWLDGRQGDLSAILDGAGDRGTRAIAETLAAMAASLTVRLTVAVGLIAEDQADAWNALAAADARVLAAQPELHATVEANLVRAQGDAIAGEGTAGSGALSAVARAASCGNTAVRRSDGGSLHAITR